MLLMSIIGMMKMLNVIILEIIRFWYNLFKYDKLWIWKRQERRSCTEHCYEISLFFVSSHSYCQDKWWLMFDTIVELTFPLNYSFQTSSSLEYLLQTFLLSQCKLVELLFGEMFSMIMWILLKWWSRKYWYRWWQCSWLEDWWEVCAGNVIIRRVIMHGLGFH